VIIFGIQRTGELVPLGKAKLDTNGVDLHFADGALARFADELRPFLLLGDRSLREWPAVDPDLLEWVPETIVFANPRGVRKDRRPVIWRGAPTAWGALLWPEVPLDALAEYEPKQSGFLRRLRRERILA
jgi:hypothetical protein